MTTRTKAPPPERHGARHAPTSRVRSILTPERLLSVPVARYGSPDDPNHPDAQKDGPHAGYVAKPNINIIQEMTSMMQASRAYEANATTVESAKQMAMKALEIGR